MIERQIESPTPIPSGLVVKNAVKSLSRISGAMPHFFAAELDMSVTTLATAWSIQHDFVASTIIGATHADQVPDILKAGAVKLSPETMKAIDAVTKEIMYPMG